MEKKKKQTKFDRNENNGFFFRFESGLWVHKRQFNDYYRSEQDDSCNAKISEITIYTILCLAQTSPNDS